MDKIINISVKDLIAVQTDDTQYICGNGDFTVVFDFDSEWDELPTKTARFKYNGSYQDVIFTGNECAVPVIENTHKIEVGVFAGNLHTTTPAYIYAKKSILCGSGVPAAPTDDVYNQIMELIYRKPIQTLRLRLELRNRVSVLRLQQARHRRKPRRP